MSKPFSLSFFKGWILVISRKNHIAGFWSYSLPPLWIVVSHSNPPVPLPSCQSFGLVSHRGHVVLLVLVENLHQVAWTTLHGLAISLGLVPAHRHCSIHQETSHAHRWGIIPILGTAGLRKVCIVRIRLESLKNHSKCIQLYKLIS